MTTLELDKNQYLEQLNAIGQGHILKRWSTLDSQQKTFLIKQLSQLDFNLINRLCIQVMEGKTSEDIIDANQLKPPGYISVGSRQSSPEKWKVAGETGEQAIKAGRVACFTVAGGQGTRLGFDGPKGLFPITPIKEKSLFQIFAEKIRAAEIDYQTSIHWFIMTSVDGLSEVKDFFEKHLFFNLKNVHFFPQGEMPAVDFKGKLMLDNECRLIMNPNGHGGALRALNQSGCIELMEEKEIDTISYFQVDNPLVHVLDPHFIGFHLNNNSEMSSKMVIKKRAEEKVGLYCELKGRLHVVEYSDMPKELNEARDVSGELSFRCGNPAIHVLDREFIKKVGKPQSIKELPFHFARKKINFKNDDGDLIEPEKPNGIKFELFLFDALMQADNALLLEVMREEEFSPVKNAEGADSPGQCLVDQQRLFAKWLRAAGADIEMNEEGLPSVLIEISPLIATNEAAFLSYWSQLKEKPSLDQDIYIG